MITLPKAKSLAETREQIQSIKTEMTAYQPDPNVIIAEGYTNDTSPEVYTFLESLVEENERTLQKT